MKRHEIRERANLGGKGSGNFGHAGRPGKRGGSTGGKGGPFGSWADVTVSPGTVKTARAGLEKDIGFEVDDKTAHLYAKGVLSQDQIKEAYGADKGTFVGWDPSTWSGRGTSLDDVGKAIEDKFSVSRPFQPSSDRLVYTRVDEGKLRGVRDGLKSGGFFYVGRGKGKYLTDGSTNVEVDVGKGRLVIDQSA